jgi:hypothetical protein
VLFHADVFTNILDFLHIACYLAKKSTFVLVVEIEYWWMWPIGKASAMVGEPLHAQIMSIILQF